MHLYLFLFFAFFSVVCLNVCSQWIIFNSSLGFIIILFMQYSFNSFTDVPKLPRFYLFFSVYLHSHFFPISDLKDSFRRRLARKSNSSRLISLLSKIRDASEMTPCVILCVVQSIIGLVKWMQVL